MIRPPLLLLLLLLTPALDSPAVDTRLVRESGPLTPAQQQAALQVPDGFAIQLFAAEPLINKPINLAFDSRGRLWVSSTVEYPYAASRDRWSDLHGSHVRDSRDAIKILEDTTGDGRAGKVTDFADGLNIPTGVLPWHKPEHHAGCIAWSIPNIWYLADTDGDGLCDLREVLFGPLGFEKDTHGMCSSFRPGPDGWVYATHGFNNTSHFRARDGSALDLHSGNVFRFQPDASRVEIWSWGQVNPFGLCFDRRGNLYSADCHSAPVYQLLRGAHYPSFGKPHDGLGFGPVMIEHTHGSTGICGIAYIDRNVWGPDWNDHILIGNPVTSRVNLDRIEFHGSTPHAVELPDFITSEDPWFRPVDLCLGPDGALYVADFYNRIIGHYEVPLDHPGRDRERGRIWRIVKNDAPSARENLEPVPLGDPMAALTHESPFIRRAAATALQDAPRPEAIAPLLTTLVATPEEDTHLRHALKLSLREHLHLPGAFASLPGDLAAPLLPVALAVPLPESAAFVWQHLHRPPTLPEARFLARQATPETLAEVIAASRPGALPFLREIHHALLERGLDPPEAWLSWARDEATALLEATSSPDWTAQGDVHWTLQPRLCTDDQETTVLSSLERGGKSPEQRTGTLTSKPFPAPARLSFWICGHRGHPSSAPHNKNHAQLIDPATGEVLRQVFPPRSDVCQPVAWDLSDVKDRPVALRITDGDHGPSYAWLAITRIEPPLVSIDRFAPAAAADLAFLAATLRDPRLAAYLPDSPPLPPPPAPAQQIDQLIQARLQAFQSGSPEATQGARVFATHCAACHQLQNQGGLAGPQLDGIGVRGAARLLEDILDPNRNVDVNFRTRLLSLKDGRSLVGFVRGEAGQALVFIDAAGQEHRLSKADVADSTGLPASLMPPIYGQTLSEAELIDLTAFLLTQQPPPAQK